MKCKGCGQEFPNVSAVTKHKPECPGLNGETPVCNAKSEIKQPEGFIIPLELCPEEIKYYAQGKVLGLRLTGKLVENGVLLQEVTLIR